MFLTDWNILPHNIVLPVSKGDLRSYSSLSPSNLTVKNDRLALFILALTTYIVITVMATLLPKNMRDSLTFSRTVDAFATDFERSLQISKKCFFNV